MLRRLDIGKGGWNDQHYWLKAAGYGFVFAWIAECMFREAFFVTAAAGGGTKFMTANVFAWILLGTLFAAHRLGHSEGSEEALAL